KKAGITLTTNQSLDLKATTFRTEAAAIVQSHPDAIMTEALGSADPTLFSEIKQLNGGKIIPIIGTSAAISPAVFKASAAAGGPTSFDSFHDSTGIFQIDTYTPSGQVKTVGTISPTELRALTG